MAAIEAAVPESSGTITFDDVPLPVPPDMQVGGLEEAIGPVAVTPVADAVRATVEHFRRQPSP